MFLTFYTETNVNGEAQGIFAFVPNYRVQILYLSPFVNASSRILSQVGAAELFDSLTTHIRTEFFCKLSNNQLCTIKLLNYVYYLTSVVLPIVL